MGKNGTEVTRRLKVTACAPCGTFDRDGETCRIYEIRAETEDGKAVAAQLRAFRELPIGELVEYRVSRYDNPRYGTSWTLSLPRSGAVKAEVKALERRL